MKIQFGSLDKVHVAMQIEFNDLAEFTTLVERIIAGGGIETAREMAFALLTQARASGDLSPQMRALEEALIK